MKIETTSPQFLNNLKVFFLIHLVHLGNFQTEKKTHTKIHKPFIKQGFYSEMNVTLAHNYVKLFAFETRKTVLKAGVLDYTHFWPFVLRADVSKQLNLYSQYCAKSKLKYKCMSEPPM